MSETWWRASVFKVEPIEVIKESPKFVTRENGRREAIDLDWCVIRREKSEALKALVAIEELKVADALSKADFFKQRLEEFKKKHFPP